MKSIHEAIDPPRKGRFPKNGIISLLETNRRLNLAESTAQDLHLRDLIDIVGWEKLEGLRLGYGSSAGLPMLRAAIADTCNIPVENVITTTGTALAIALLAVEVCRPGDEMVLVSPCFPPSRDVFCSLGVNVHEVKLEFETCYVADPDRIGAALSEKTRLICLASPQNPSGVQTSLQALSAILAQMTRRAPKALLFVDETYRVATYGDRKPMASAAALDHRILTGSSVSKAHGTPGLRVGWLTVADRELRERLTVAKMNIVISVSVLSETLASALLEKQEAVLAPRRALLAKALGTLEKWHATEAHRLDWVRPDAGALCCMRLKENLFDNRTVNRFWELLPSSALQLASGAWFGETARVFRLGFGYLGLELLEEALSSLTRSMDQA